MEALEKVQSGTDPHEGHVVTDELFQDKGLSEAHAAAEVGLLKLLAPLYTFSPKASIYSADIHKIWGTSEISEFNIGQLEYRESDGVKLMDISIYFESRWSPPVDAIAKFTELVPAADVLLFFSEPGHGFCGEYVKLTPALSNVDSLIQRDMDINIDDFCLQAENTIGDLYRPQDSEILYLSNSFKCTYALIEWLLSQFEESIEALRAQRLEYEEGRQEEHEEEPEDDFEPPF